MRLFPAFFVSLLMLGAVAPAQADPVSERRAGFRDLLDAMGAWKDAADRGADPAAHVGRIDQMLSWSRKMESFFPAGSTGGETKALAAIWTDPAGFAKAKVGLVVGLEELRAAAAAGSSSDFSARFRDVVQSCAACHRGFRAP